MLAGHNNSANKYEEIERNNFNLKFRLYQLTDDLNNNNSDLSSLSDLSQNLSDIRNQLEFTKTGLQELGCDIDNARDYNSIVQAYEEATNRVKQRRNTEKKDDQIPPKETAEIEEEADILELIAVDGDEESQKKKNPAAENIIVTESAPPPEVSKPASKKSSNNDDDEQPEEERRDIITLEGFAPSPPEMAGSSTPTRPSSSSSASFNRLDGNNKPEEKLPSPPQYSVVDDADPFSNNVSTDSNSALVQENRQLKQQIEQLKKEQHASSHIQPFELYNLRSNLYEMTKDEIKSSIDKIISSNRTAESNTGQDNLICILKHSYQRVKTQRDNLKIIRAYQTQELTNYKQSSLQRVKLLKSLGVITEDVAEVGADSSSQRRSLVSAIWALRFAIRLQASAQATKEKQNFIKSLLES